MWDGDVGGGDYAFERWWIKSLLKKNPTFHSHPSPRSKEEV